MAVAVQQFDIEGIVVEFLADASRLSLEFPHLTTGQRKHAKTVAESNLELECVSYGMGSERKLHIFKKGPPKSTSSKMADRKIPKANSTASVKNTFIDDWVATEEEDHPSMLDPGLIRSMPPQLCKSTMPFNCLSYAPPISVKSNICAYQTDLTLSRPSISTCSTVASSASSTVDSPRSQCAEPQLKLPSFFRPPPGLEVQNTFVHFKDTHMDERIVQSMPHDMFRQSLMEEAAAVAALPTKDMPARIVPTSSHVLAAGTEVIIQGLLKLPAFNGLSGKVDSLDEETGRYTILLTEAVGHHKVAKVKFENLRRVSPRRAPALRYDESEDSSTVGSPVWPSTPLWGEQRPERNLMLSALV